MRLRAIALTLVASAVAFPAAAGATGRSAAAAAATTAAASRPIASLSGPISDERTVTYWANAAASSAVRTAPRWSARRLVTAGRTVRLHLRTEDGFPEVYLVLAQEVYPNETWFRIRIPGRPNGRTGWVPEQGLDVLHVVHTHLIVDERTFRLTLYRNGHPIFSAPIGYGKPSTPTPTGNFWIREKFPAQGGEYGPYAFGTADYSVLSDWPRGGIIGIHGTDQPQLIPGRPSHGCIRMLNADITRLYPLVPVGTPLTVTG